jgi:hypothetical protein
MNGGIAIDGTGSFLLTFYHAFVKLATYTSCQSNTDLALSTEIPRVTLHLFQILVVLCTGNSGSILANDDLN